MGLTLKHHLIALGAAVVFTAALTAVVYVGLEHRAARTYANERDMCSYTPDSFSLAPEGASPEQMTWCRDWADFRWAGQKRQGFLGPAFGAAAGYGIAGWLLCLIGLRRRRGASPVMVPGGVSARDGR